MCAFQADAPALHDHTMGRDTQSGVCVLLNRQKSAARPVHQGDRLKHLPQRLGVQAHRGLVQQNQRGIKHQAARELHEALLPAREVPRFLAGELLDLAQALADQRLIVEHIGAEPG